MTTIPPPYYCPRSCRKGRTYPTLEAVKKHVRDQHPEYDPEWYDTYPEELGVDEAK